MRKRSILVWKKGKSKNTILHAPVWALLETYINQGQEVLTNFYIMLAEFFKESDRVHSCPEVSTPQQREEWTHQPCGAVVTYMEDRKSDDKDSVIPLLIYPEDYDNNESLRDPPSMEPTTETGPPSKKPTKERTLEPNSDALSETYAPKRDTSMGNLYPKRHHEIP